MLDLTPQIIKVKRGGKDILTLIILPPIFQFLWLVLIFGVGFLKYLICGKKLTKEYLYLNIKLGRS